MPSADDAETIAAKEWEMTQHKEEKDLRLFSKGACGALWVLATIFALTAFSASLHIGLVLFSAIVFTYLHYGIRLATEVAIAVVSDRPVGAYAKRMRTSDGWDWRPRNP